MDLITWFVLATLAMGVDLRYMELMDAGDDEAAMEHARCAEAIWAECIAAWPEDPDTTRRPPPGSWADVASAMHAMDPTYNWDAWKDSLKEGPTS